MGLAGCPSRPRTGPGQALPARGGARGVGVGGGGDGGVRGSGVLRPPPGFPLPTGPHRRAGHSACQVGRATERRGRLDLRSSSEAGLPGRLQGGWGDGSREKRLPVGSHGDNSTNTS
ncbi:hypothetical protein VULLAG_LOCUS8389 [Vulpes lagopus]